MRERRAERAIVLAAGTGSRLASSGHLSAGGLSQSASARPIDELPKPLRDVGGVPLLVRVLRGLQSEGIREAIVVTGFDGERVRRRVASEPSLGLSLTFVDNELFRLKNGVSLLAARRYVVPGTILTMADHLYSPEVVRRLRSMDLPEGSSALAVDYDIERCFDLDDATKVWVDSGQITGIGKDIQRYNALDTGVFRIGPELTDELAILFEKHGDCSLSEGVARLAASGRFAACDVGDARWIDVDTPAAMERAEAMIRVFGDALGDEPTESVGRIEPEGMETFAPTWVRAAQPYREDHFEVAAAREGVLRMMSNESPYAPSPRVLAAIVEAASQGNLYPTSAATLRGKLGARDALDGDHVLLGAGSTELIDVVIRTFVAPGEEVLLSVPTFSMYEARTRAVGGIPVLVPMCEEGGIDASALISAVTERTKVLFLCTPNNPTGDRLDEAAVRRVLRLGLPTVIDEAYWELGEAPQSLSPLLSDFPNAIILRTFSKAFGLAGMRIGYALAHPVVIRLLSRVKVPWNLSILTLAAASAAIDDVAEQEARLSGLREGRRYLSAQLAAMPGIDVWPSEGNFILLDASRTGARAEAIAAAMLDLGVMVRTLSTHHADLLSPVAASPAAAVRLSQRASRSLLRITVGSPEQNTRCVEALREVLSGLAATPIPPGVTSEAPVSQRAPSSAAGWPTRARAR